MTARRRLWLAGIDFPLKERLVPGTNVRTRSYLLVVNEKTGLVVEPLALVALTFQ